MLAVGLRGLKNRLSEYMRRVRSGETVWVTDRGEIIAEIRPPGQTSATPVDPGIESLAKRGLLTPRAENDSGAYPSLPRGLKRRSSLDLLNDERGRR